MPHPSESASWFPLVSRRRFTELERKLLARERIEEDARAVLYDACIIALDRKRREGTDADALSGVLRALEVYLDV